jgi:hypothetical protein
MAGRTGPPWNLTGREGRATQANAYDPLQPPAANCAAIVVLRDNSATRYPTEIMWSGAPSHEYISVTAPA